MDETSNSLSGTNYHERSESLSLYLALADDAFYIQLEQQIIASGREGRQGMLHYYDYSIQTAQATGRLTVPHDGADWGAALWSLPLEPHENQPLTAQQKAAYFTEHLGRPAYEHYQAVCESMAKLTKPFIDKTDWYLSIIAIAPEYQSRGLGKELMKPVLREADEAGVGTYLETFVPRNIRFYERLGYAVIRELYEPVLATHYHLLRRSAGG